MAAHVKASNFTFRSMGNTPAVSSALQHYCRVCNTQLNSCKQARIHVEGKKHEKRLAYLKFCLDTSEAVSAYTYPGPPGGAQSMACPVSSVMTTALPTVYAYPPPCGTYPPSGPTYYYPPAISSYQHPAYQQQYHDYSPPPHPTAGQPAAPPTASHAQGAGGHAPPAPPPSAQASHGVMSPSLTSGFSGSGDCKSTETCSLLSVASYSSGPPQGGGGGGGGGGGRDGAATDSEMPQAREPAATGAGSRPRPAVSCDVCQLPFPSRAVLDHHLMGSRHARKVKAELVLRQLVEQGAEFRHSEGGGGGEIRCEVCEVAVNSSHQLQAHMAGQSRMKRCCCKMMLSVDNL